MTPQPKSRTIGCWLILDDHGDTWRVQCLACDGKTAHSKRLLQGAVVPRCKCGGKVPSKPVEASKPLTPAVVPVQVVAPVLTPRSTKPALIGKRPDSEMEADRVAKLKPPRSPSRPRSPSQAARSRVQC